MKIDLHIHTDKSDGTFTPEQVVDRAVERGMKTIAVTDHDTVSGIEPALRHITKNNIGLELVPGIEFGCDEKELGFVNVHIIGLFIDFRNKRLLELTDKIRQDRIKQKKEIIRKLNELGFDITFEEVSKSVKGSFGRPHIARLLLKRYPDKFSTIKDVFDQYIGTGKPAYVERTLKIRMKEAIDVIKAAGGLCFLAHPGVYSDKDAAELIDLFIKNGGEGIETYYPYDVINKTPKEESIAKNQLFKSIAEKRNLLESGGTDFHGDIRGDIGSLDVDKDILTRIHARL
ncbi:phosphatase [Candidatus Woesearchaeota archaeon]|nr:phosphatase [Candidatus Woesearchaeota archaeon]|tara:strand:- start:15422 stop:16282 length:861 start_codon:yes stop_codon:yes gene_type:complete